MCNKIYELIKFNVLFKNKSTRLILDDKYTESQVNIINIPFKFYLEPI